MLKESPVTPGSLHDSAPECYFGWQRGEAARLASPPAFFVEIGCGFARQAFMLCELSEGITRSAAVTVRSDIVDVL